MAKYSSYISGVAYDTSNDLRTVYTTATGAGSVVNVYEIFLAGESASSTVARLGVNRPGTAGITPTAQTLGKLNPASATNSFNVATTWSTQPVVSATAYVLIPTFNAFGGVIRWVAPPGSEVVVGTQGAVANLSFRSISGTPTVSGHILIEEL